MPLWGFVAVGLLLCAAAFAFGVEVGRDLADSRPDVAAGIDRYTRPVLVGALVGATALCLALGGRGGRAPRGPARGP